jgi:hypothetical protein
MCKIFRFHTSEVVAASAAELRPTLNFFRRCDLTDNLHGDHREPRQLTAAEWMEEFNKRFGGR